MLLLALLCAAHQPPAPEAFVTLLGRDTVALESFTRTTTPTATRTEGDVMIRVPGTVLFHYVVETTDAGTPTRTVLDMRPLGIPTLPERRTTIDVGRDSIRITIDSAGTRRRETRALPGPAVATFMTGLGASYGLYSSLGLYETILAHLPSVRAPNGSPDTVRVPEVHVATGRSTRRTFVRRSPTAVDVDYFGMAWTHLTLDADGRITSADARATTEQTMSTRVEAADVPRLDVPRLARAFAARDRSGAGAGLASPNRSVRASVDGADVVVAFGSPHRRGRTILGDVVPYDRVWRTGANEATVIAVDRDVVLGGTRLAAGSYSLWTVPTRDSVTLVVNRQAGQWGTDHDPARDVARIPMRVETRATPQDDFVVEIAGPAHAHVLRMAWDTFQWSVPIGMP